MTLAERAQAAIASYWTAGIAWGVMTALHARWLWQWKHTGEVVSGYGAGLIALGLAHLLAAYLQPHALDRATAGAMPQDWRSFHRAHDPTASDRRQALWIEIRKGIITERIVVAILVLIGTFLNGYGTPLARSWNWPV